MRRIVAILSALVVLALAALLLSPYWIGLVLPWAARRLDAEIGSYSRHGYGRFALADVSVKRPGVLIRVDRVEADTPWLWAVRHIAGRDRRVIAGSWSVEIVPTGTPRAPRQESGWWQLHGQLMRIADTLNRWIPQAQLGPGRVAWPGQQLTLRAADWTERNLSLEGLQYREHEADAAAKLGVEPSALELLVSLKNRPFRLHASGDAHAVRGHLEAWGESASLEAQFLESGWLPHRARLDAVDWTLSGPDIGVPQYATIEGALHGQWENEQFVLRVDANGTPAPAARPPGGGAASPLFAGGSAVPPLHVIAEIVGNRLTYSLNRLDVQSPGVSARLGAPVIVNLRGRQPEYQSRFAFALDLAKFPQAQTAGQLTGTLEVDSGSERWPVVRFRTDGSKLVHREWELSTLRAEGEFAWPRLAVTSFEAAAAPVGRMTGSLAADLEAKELLEARVEGRAPYPLVKRLLPEAVSFGVADFVVQARGSFSAPKHEGTAVISAVQVKGVQPAAVRLWWRGQAEQVDQFEGGIQAKATEVVFAGGLTPESCELTKLVWRHDAEDRLTLQRPARVRWKPGVSVDAFDLVGPAGELRLTAQWGEVGDVRFFARGIAAEWWQDFVPDAPFHWSVDRFSLTGKWDRGPVSLETSGLVLLTLRGGQQISLDLSARGDGEVLTVERLRGLEEGTAFVNFEGSLPLGIEVSPRPKLTLSRTAAIELRGKVEPNARWWGELAQRTGVRLVDPDLDLAISGSWENPQGTASLALSEISLPAKEGGRKLPRIQNVSMELVAQPDQIRLDPVRATIEGQLLSAAAVMPASRETWDELRRDARGTMLKHGEATIRAAGVQLAPLVPYLSPTLLPQGTLDMDLTVSAEGPLRGYLRAQGLGTRPLGSVGPLRQIAVDIRAEERRFTLQRVQATLGGRVVTANGSIHLPPGETPSYNLAVSGQNLPFVRQQGLLVRGDVALNLNSAPGKEPPTVRGEIKLRDSLFLTDVRALVPGGAASAPERRPPYFVVTEDPFSSWRLDVAVAGERFLRARTPLFNGVASMRFKLLGSLGDPRAVGEVRVNEGQVLFPFARFRLRDASVRLTEENPYDPQLAVFGTSRRYGYDLRLELTGSANTPNLSFSSNPPLSSEQVLLLVMAGETPKDEVNYSTTQRFARLGTFFGQSLLGGLTGGEGGDRLTVSSGESISRQGRETYDVEYEVNEDWSITGEYDEFDEYNVGLKRRILPRKEKGDTNGNR